MQLLSLSSLFPTWNCHFSAVSRMSKKMLFSLQYLSSCCRHYTILYHTTPHYATLHCTTPYYIRLHHTTPLHTTLYYTTPQYTMLYYTTLHYTTLHYTTQLAVLENFILPFILLTLPPQSSFLTLPSLLSPFLFKYNTGQVPSSQPVIPSKLGWNPSFRV